MIYLLIASSFLLSVFLSALIIPRILVVAFRRRLFDIPNERKVHTGVVPRLGGLSFVPTILFSLSFITAVRYLLGIAIDLEMLSIVVPEFFFLVCGLTLLYLSGIKDDLVGLRYRTKFVIQIISACFFPLSGLWLNNLYGIFGIYELSPWIGIPFTIFTVVFITNAINLIDGIDGLASGLSSVALLIFGVLFLVSDLWTYSMLAFATLGVLLPFFYYNVFGKAERCKKIFMGDTGSLTLGYLLSFLAIRYSINAPDIIPYSKGAFIMAFSSLLVPVLDVLRVVFVRWRKHKGLFIADKNHIHHKFLAIGFTARKAMLSILFIACAFSLLNILLINYIDSTIIVIVDFVFWIVLNIRLDRSRKMLDS